MTNLRIPQTPIPDHELLGKRFKFHEIQTLVITRLQGDAYRLDGYDPPVHYELPVALVHRLIYEGLLEEV